MDACNEEANEIEHGLIKSKQILIICMYQTTKKYLTLVGKIVYGELML